jgi:hypothetical protein
MQCIADYTDTPDSRARLVRYTFGDLERERIDECEQCNQQSFVVQVKFCANHRNYMVSPLLKSLPRK